MDCTYVTCCTLCTLQKCKTATISYQNLQITISFSFHVEFEKLVTRSLLDIYTTGSLLSSLDQVKIRDGKVQRGSSRDLAMWLCRLTRGTASFSPEMYVMLG